MMPTLSVVLCTQGRPEELSVCLKSLLKQQYPPMEIVVIDTHPEDTGTQVLMRHRFPGCRYVPGPELRLASARNLGIAESFGEVIAFIGDGCRPMAGWSRAIAQSFAGNPFLGCCTGPVLPLELKTRAQRLLEERGGFSKGFARVVFNRNSPHRAEAYPVQSWRFGTGANMSFMRSTLLRIGGFDTSLRSAEDLEIFFRVLRADFELVYEPKAIVFHQYPRTYLELRRTLHLWGHGYISALLKIADIDPLYRDKALSEASSWFWSFQLRDRLFGGFFGNRRRFPPGLVLAEISGGARALAEYLFHRPGPRAEESRVTPRFFSPFIRILRRWT
jgi:GT2 family glycosyltransferase